MAPSVHSGRIDQTLNYRPLKALKYVKGEDSRFDLLVIPTLYRYPVLSVKKSGIF